MNTKIIMTLLATLTVGGAIGGGVTHLMLNTQVTCPASVDAKHEQDGMRKFLKSTPIPLTGYRSY